MLADLSILIEVAKPSCHELPRHSDTFDRGYPGFCHILHERFELGLHKQCSCRLRPQEVRECAAARGDQIRKILSRLQVAQITLTNAQQCLNSEGAPRCVKKNVGLTCRDLDLQMWKTQSSESLTIPFRGKSGVDNPNTSLTSRAMAIVRDSHLTCFRSSGFFVAYLKQNTWPGHRDWLARKLCIRTGVLSNRLVVCG